LTIRDGAPFSRDDLVQYLNHKRIGTRLLFGSNLLRQPYMNGRDHRTVGELNNSNIVVDRTFWIGVYPGLGEDELAWMIDAVYAFCSNKHSG
ncbi:MAG: lipopolysaccharide biosynthesis protein RfbH, partial [Magnetovibrio sp.]|nr:lipopolysaccharide biosynthesis protein RfbH [Magnetovibrio sp.]